MFDKILIIDDDPDMCLLLTKFLTKRGISSNLLIQDTKD